MVSVGPKGNTPALFTRMSTFLLEFLRAWAARSRAASALRRGRRPRRRQSLQRPGMPSTTARPLSLSRPLTATVAPALARASVAALSICRLVAPATSVASQ